MGNAPHYAGGTAYVDNKVCFGRISVPMTPLLPALSGIRGFPIVANSMVNRVIPEWYYQAPFTEYGLIPSPDFYIDTDFILQNVDIPMSKVNEYSFPGLFNTSKKLNTDYAKIQKSESRLITRINNTNIVQNGFFKWSVDNNTFVIKSGHYFLNSMDSTIAYSDAEYKIVDKDSLEKTLQDYSYKSVYESDGNILGDSSTLYEGDSVNTLSLTANGLKIDFNTVFDDAKAKFAETLAVMSEPPANVDIFPTLDDRPMQEPSIIYATITDENYKRIDDALTKAGDPAQISNIKWFEVSITPGLVAIVHFSIVGITHKYITHLNPYGKNVAEWVPVAVQGDFSYKVTTGEEECIKYSYIGYYLSHYSYFGQCSKGDTGILNVGIEANKTPYTAEEVYTPSGNIYCKLVHLGVRTGEYNNIAIDKVDVISKNYTIPITDYLYFDSGTSTVKAVDGNKSIIKIKARCDFGLSQWRGKDVLLLENVAYLIKEDTILKKVDLSNLFESGYTPMITTLEYTEYVKKILKAVNN